MESRRQLILRLLQDLTNSGMFHGSQTDFLPRGKVRDLGAGRGAVAVP